ncbi:MAG: pyridine nucleotide-disulfide oxidoreductase [Alphaproteobacteria bacterium]|nr:MAG: pyridine nucleotide-disulfide oxidoreductase [Alphaproteobacteria bacterium]
MTDTFIIVGAGQAGGQAAATLRSKGFEGRIVLIGEENYVPYERPPLSKAFLAGELPVEKTFLKKPDFYDNKNIELRLGRRVVAIDRQARTVNLDNGESIGYDKLLLATGSRVRKLTVPGAELSGIHYLRDIADVEGIRAAMKPGARLAIVGAGYIGLEVAAVARKLGHEVTVVEALDRVMARVVAPQVSAFYEKVHREAGVDLRLGTGLTAFEGDGRFEQLRLTDGSAVPGDLAVVGIGIVPNVELAQEIGLKVDNGIVVDEYGRTEDPDIFAAGDVTNHPNAILGRNIRLESVQNAMSQAMAAALAMLGHLEAYNEVPWFWSDQYDLKLQIAGLWEPDDEIVVRGDMESRKFSVVYLRDGAIAAINVINNMRDFLPAKKLIEAKSKVDPARLADPEVPLKEFLTT